MIFRKALRAMARRHAARKAEAERTVLVAQLKQAINAHDDRATGERFRPAFEATCAALAASVGRRPQAWRGQR